jgi:REP element-mobilizing transposase RayT
MYFVTICNEDGEHLLGNIVNGTMIMNDAGRMVETVWKGLPERFADIVMDEYVVMPNHFHGIIILSDRRGEPCVRPIEGNNRRGEPCVRPYKDINKDQGEHKEGDHKDRPYSGTHEHSLGRIIQAFKSLMTVEYAKCVERDGWPPFPGKLWQRGYYDRIIRNEAELNAARKYIMENPMKWVTDEENPDIA